MRGPAGVAIVAGGRRIPAVRVHTCTATARGGKAGRSCPPQPRLAEAPAPRPGLPGPALHPDPQLLGLGPSCRRRHLVTAPPAAATGLRSLTRLRRSSRHWPQLHLAPAPGWASGGRLLWLPRLQRLQLTETLLQIFMGCTNSEFQRRQRRGLKGLPEEGAGTVESSGHGAKVTGGGAGDLPRSLKMPPLVGAIGIASPPWSCGSSRPIAVSREPGVPFMAATGGRRRRRGTRRRVWPRRGDAARSLSPPFGWGASVRSENERRPLWARGSGGAVT